MFEKEAEEIEVKADEYALEESTACNYGESSKHVYQGYFYGFKKGAEFGYNKANEWHKPSEKLPKECSLVLAYSFEDTEPALWEFVTSDQWEWLPKRIVFCSNDQIRLWKEIVPPKEIKEK